MNVAPLLVAVARRRPGRLGRFVALFAASVFAVPLMLVLLVLALFAGSPEAECADQSAPGIQIERTTPPAGLTERQRALFSTPLEMEPGRWYRVGATTFYAGDGTGTGTRGAIPDGDQSDLSRHPDTFAELSLKTENNGVTFETANALGRLPWMAAVRVAYRGRSVVVHKRDIGFGQGASTIDGERYRIDLWGPAARALGTSSNLVQIQLLPRSGAGATLGDIPEGAAGGDRSEIECVAPGPIGGPLPLTAGQRARLQPNGLAAAPREAPDAVKRVIAAGNEIVGKPYVYGGGHGLPLSQVSPSYDCSSSVSYLLHGGGLASADYTPASGEMAAGYGQPGYGRWISLLANGSHVYMYVAGLRWDTHRYGSGDQGVDGIGWHTARRPDTGFTPRHPEGY